MHGKVYLKESAFPGIFNGKWDAQIKGRCASANYIIPKHKDCVFDYHLGRKVVGSVDWKNAFKEYATKLKTVGIKLGSVLSRVVELVYNDELWREPQNLKDKVTEIAEKEFLLQEQGKYLDWRFMPREEAIATCVTGAVNFLKIMKHNRLLGDYARSEVRMDPWLNQVEKDLKICGIADLIYRDRDGKVHILDGKNASTPGKYEDDDQLRWYALCYRLVYGVNPDGLAFFYFRYPPNTPPEKFTGDWTGMIKVDFNDDDLKRLAKEGLETQKAIKNKNYEPNPMPKHCVNCPFEDICEPRQEQKKINSAKRNKNKEHIEISKEPVNVSNSLKILNFGDK